MRWLAKRFRYTRELEKKVREQDQEIHAFEVVKRIQSGMIKEWEEFDTTFSKMTLAELQTVLSACVDYQRALRRVNAADPIQYRIGPIFDKYEITWERNTLADEVIEEVKRRENAD